MCHVPYDEADWIVGGSVYRDDPAAVADDLVVVGGEAMTLSLCRGKGGRETP